MSFGLSAAALVVESANLEWLPTADDRPARLGRQVEAQQSVVALGDLERRVAVAIFLGQPIDLVVEHIR